MMDQIMLVVALVVALWDLTCLCTQEQSGLECCHRDSLHIDMYTTSYDICLGFITWRCLCCAGCCWPCKLQVGTKVVVMMGGGSSYRPAVLAATKGIREPVKLVYLLGECLSGTFCNKYIA